MLVEESLLRKIAKRKGLDVRVVGLIARYPFHFVRELIKNPIDLRPVRLMHLGLFVLKPRYYKGLLPKKNNREDNNNNT